MLTQVMQSNTTRRHAYGPAERVGAEHICPTEPAEKAIVALRAWTLAQIVPELRAELKMWDSLELASNLNEKGLRCFIDNHPDFTDEEKELFLIAAPLVGMLKDTLRKRVGKSKEGKKADQYRRRILKGANTDAK